MGSYLGQFLLTESVKSTHHSPAKTAIVSTSSRLEHEDWGEGAVRGVSGGDMAGIRNVLTFPPEL